MLFYVGIKKSSFEIFQYLKFNKQKCQMTELRVLARFESRYSSIYNDVLID